MPLNYELLRQENEERYGWDIGRIGKQILADTYADRTHFIFELLQNAEDALLRRGPEWTGSRTISFHLTQSHLRISHFGDPFNEADVRGICGIADSYKAGSLTAIGRFGIGFKSVYAFTDRPEIHSGPEDFVIENFVWPKAAPQMDDKHTDETVFALPLKSDDASGYDEISTGLRDLGSRTLLFLRHIEEIAWSVDGGGSGCYLREKTHIDNDVRRVTVIGQTDGDEAVAEEWLTFSRAVSHDQRPAGWVEIAFKLDPEIQRIHPVREASHLVVFFPTILDTRLGFLMQGPYRTTSTRDNVPPVALWNQFLVAETSLLLEDALRWLRDRGELDVDTLSCLPVEPQHPSLFAPIVEATKKILSREPFLPRFGGGYTSADYALLGRSQELRRLFSPSQLAVLYASDQELPWLSGDITQDRAPKIRSYLMQELNVVEVTPADIVRRLNRQFLESQSADWLLALYEFLNGRSESLLRHYLTNDVPIVRLASGAHVTAKANGAPQAFLPSEVQTDFPTVAAAVCASDAALSFLRSLGLNKPDLVDDVIEHVLPKYQGDTVRVTDYEKDLNRILRASRTDSSAQRRRLISELAKASFVLAIDAGGNPSTRWSKPGEVYLPTDRLKALFDGVEEILFLDRSLECLRSEEVYKLLEECGASKRLQRIESPSEFTDKELRDMRVEKTGYSAATQWRGYTVEDWTLRGLSEVLGQFSMMSPCQRREKAKLLWEELTGLAYQLSGTYTWFYYQDITHSFDAKFVRDLNRIAWVPDANGNAALPRYVLFESLGWDANPLLESKIRFKSQAQAELAREAGVEAEAIDLLKVHKVSAAKLRDWIMPKDPNGADGDPPGQQERRITHGLGGVGNEGVTHTDPDEPEPPFARVLYEVQTINPANAPDSPPRLPVGGPNTDDSALIHTQQSRLHGRSGRLVQKHGVRWVPDEVASDLASEFRDMVHGDYGKRCQICGSSFMMPTSRESQVFVVHVVPPSADDRTNHFGDLLGLCGWHYSLVRYGAWSLVDPVTDRPFGDADRMRASVLKASQAIDFDGNPYVGLPIQFANIFRDWSAEPTTITAEIRYSIPHWKYLRELLST